MPQTQINGAQIQDQSLNTNEFAPHSVDGVVIKEGSITDDLLASGIQAEKVQLKDETNNYTKKDVEGAMAEISDKLNKAVDDINATIDTQVNRLSNSYATSKLELTQKINDVNSDLSLQLHETKTTLDQKIVDEVAKLNTAIDTTEDELTTLIYNQANTLNTKIDTTKQTISDEMDQAVTNLTRSINDNKVATDADIAALTETVSDDVDTINAKIDSNVAILNQKIDSNKTATDTDIQNLNDSINNTINTQIATINDEISDLQTSVNNTINTQIATINGEITTINNTVTTNKNAADNSIAGINDQISTINSEITTINSTIATNKTSADNSIATINGQITTINNTVTANKTASDNSIATINSEITTINGEISTINSEITTINNTVTANKTSADNSIATINGEITTINNTITANQTALQAAKADKTGNVANDFSVKNLTVGGDILPTGNKTQNIGSTTNRFKGIYVDEAYLSTNTLYLGNTPVLGTNTDTIEIKADVDQDITIKTTGAGESKVLSTAGVTLATSGQNADVIVQATGMGSRAVLSANNQVSLTAPYVNVTGDTNITGNTAVQNLTVNGTFTMNGQAFTVNSTTVQTQDNIIEINKGQVGSGVSAGQAGLKVDRGDAPAYYMVFDEGDDMFKVGMSGSLQTIASQNWVSSVMYVHPSTHPATMIVDDSTHRFVTDTEKATWNAKASTAVATTSADGLMSAADKTKLNGIATGATLVASSTTNGNIKINGVETGVYTLPATLPATMITADSTHRFVADTDIATWNAKASTAVVTTSVNGLMSAADKTKLDGIAALADNVTTSTTNGNILINGVESVVYTHPASHPATMITGLATVATTGAFADLVSKPTTLAGYGITDAALATHTHTVDALSNVTITSKANGDLLQWNGTAWVNKTVASLGLQPAGSYLTANQNITLSGDVTGTGNTAITVTLASVGTAGTYTKVTTDAKGRVISGTTLVAADIPSLDWTKITSGKPTTLSGYGITDAAPSASPALTGTPTAPTAAASTNNTQIATTAFVKSVAAPFNGTTSAAGYFDNGTTAPTDTTTRMNYNGNFYATKVYNAVYNDYAEYFLKDEELVPGDVVAINPNGEGYIKTTKAYDKMAVGVVSDDFAQCIGGKGDGNDDIYYASVGMAGRVRVKVVGKVEAGDLLVASEIPGVAMASKEYIPGTVIGKALQAHDGDCICRIKMLVVNM